MEKFMDAGAAVGVIEKKKFMDDNFLLSTDTAVTLYHDYAKEMPICDYHCHLNPKEIAEDKRYKNITEIWLGGDHYKWRTMRSFGIEEKYITGDATDYEKFEAFAKVMPYLIGNPMYHWSHLELKRYFGIEETLSPKTCKSIWDRCNEIINGEDFSARAMIKNSNVKYIGTTDDPIDNLEYHIAIAKDESFDCEVRPSFRPDRAVKIHGEGFADYIAKLGEVENTEIKDYETLLTVLEKRLDFFVENGCNITDHSLERVYFRNTTMEEVDAIFKKALTGETLTIEEIEKYSTLTMISLGRMYSKRGMVMQLHIGALRNNNTRMFNKVGADAGFDSIDDGEIAYSLSRILDELDKELEKREHKFCRYADDCNIYVKSKRAGERVMDNITNFIEGKLKLKVNRSKSAVERPWKRKFLGFTIMLSFGKACTTISKQSLKRYKDKIREILSRSKPMTLEQRIIKMNQINIGWINYYGIAKCKGIA